ncbi:hypothetical protein [Polaromonas sp.]|uniref:hypothetical protein n=1 Tax=Polaromonas sp. TaxID=1869339 RepID=UPI0013B7BBEB|nr:hypothetical protein [Polaromonas sp.]NDP63453.1 hypothetical protein [Polaromonas sp.]
MPSIINCEWSISRLYVDSSDVSDDNPNKAKLVKAIQFLRAREGLKKKKEIDKLEAQAWNAMLPMQLEVNFSDGDIFDLGGQVTIEMSDKNTSWSIWTEQESVGFHLSVKFDLEAMSNVTEKQLRAWERKSGWDFIGVSIATEGYEMDNGSEIQCSVVEE